MTSRRTDFLLGLIALALIAHLLKDLAISTAWAAEECRVEMPSEIKVRITDLPSDTLRVDVTDKVVLETFQNPIRVKQVE